jgi:hypothetical protein
MDDQQDSARLELGSIWVTAQCLNLCEVEQLLKTPYLHAEASGLSKPHIELAFKHARRFGKMKDTQTLHELRMALDDWEALSGMNNGQTDIRLAPFEQAQLVNLTPNDADEARALIPSLSRFNAVDITSVLDVIASFMKTSVINNI